MLEKVRRLLGEQQDSEGDYPQTDWTDQFLIDGVNQANDRLERDQFWWLKQRDTSLVTVVDQEDYALPAGIQSVEAVYVGDVGPGLEYTPVSPFDFENVVGGTCYTLMSDGASPGTAYIRLHPTPDAAGQTITIRGTWRQQQLSAYPQGTITITAQPSASSGTFVIDTQTFTWTLARGSTGDIPYGSVDPTIAQSMANLVTYVNTDLTTVRAAVSGTNTVSITAVVPGENSDAIVFTNSSSQMTMDGSGTLGGTVGFDTVSSLPDRYHMYFVWSAVAYAREREEEPMLADRARGLAQEIYDDIWRNELFPGGQEIARFKHPGEYLR